MKNTQTDSPQPKLTVMCVDDELNILKSMRRLLHKADFELLLAEGGEQALAQMKKQTVHLVISDMKMPNMNGAEFLAQVAQLYPDTYRIILSGFADMESTIEAVNKGKIHRFLQKPWDNQELLKAIQGGLGQVKLKFENERLQMLIAKQNLALKEANRGLEDKVNLRTKQIRAALKRIEQDHLGTQKVLFNCISANPLLSGEFAKRVSQLARKLAHKMSLENQLKKDITLAGLLCEIGLLGLDSKLYTQPLSELNYNQQQELLNQTNMASLILGPAPHLQSVTNILVHQFEHYNGKGHPDGQAQSDISVGARVLSIARDYCRYAMKKVSQQTMTDVEIRAEMTKHKGTLYDPDVLDILLQNPELVSANFDEGSVTVSALKPGMVLAENLYNDNHLLILPEGHEFSEDTILKLAQYEKSQAQKLTLAVDLPDPD